jgi:NitT/TauT family transport system substrate-binding protein
MRVRSRVMAGVLVGLLGVALAGCGDDEGQAAASEDGVVTVRVAHNSNAAALPARVAEEQGFFEDHGLNVEFTQVEDVATLPPALGTTFDIVLSAPTLEINATTQNIPMVVVSGATVDTPENPTAAIVASEASGITSIEDMEGKTLGSLSPTGTIGIASLYWMKEAGVDLSSVEVIAVNGPQQADQLAAGRVDAVVSVAPFTTAMLAQPGSVNLGDPYLEMADKLSGINWASSKEWADENGETIDNFRAALDDAIAFIGENDADARTILQGYTQLPDAVVENLVFPTYETEVRQEDLDVWLEAMREVDDFQGEVDTEAMVVQN